MTKNKPAKGGNYMQKITPCLWFDNQAEEAANFYTSIFKNSKIDSITRYGKEGYEIHGREEGTVMTVDFEIEKQKFTALNGGPVFKFNEAISFVVHCGTQEEIDYYWEKLTAEGGQVALRRIHRRTRGSHSRAARRTSRTGR